VVEIEGGNPKQSGRPTPASRPTMNLAADSRHNAGDDEWSGALRGLKYVVLVARGRTLHLGDERREEERGRADVA